MNDDQPVEHSLSRAEGDFRVVVLADGTLNPPSAAVFGDPDDDCLVRIQSRCVYGEIYGSVNCRCRAQLDRTIELIKAEGAGVIVYLDQEGHGAGLLAKAKRYHEAQRHGWPEKHDQDVRSFEAAGALLNQLNLSRVRLLTNNPAKVVGLEHAGIVVKPEKLPVGTKGGHGPKADYPIPGAGNAQLIEHHLSRPHGDFRVMVLADGSQNPASAAVFGDPHDDCLVRIQSRCVYGEIFGSVNCDCRAQLDRSIELIEAEGSGVIVYLDQEGRGAGLRQKAKGYHISQTLGLDTFASYRHLGLEPDTRSFSDAVTLLNQLRLSSVRLLTNNPAKVDELRNAGIRVHREVLLDDIPSEYALAYLIAKEEHGHVFRQEPIAVDAAGL